MKIKVIRFIKRNTLPKFRKGVSIQRKEAQKVVCYFMLITLIYSLPFCRKQSA